MNGDNNHCAITVAAEPPALLKSSAGTCSCYIFRVPKSLSESNANAYKPRVVSVGPYHHGQEQLKLIEQHKPRVFDTLLIRTGGCMDNYFNAVASRETHIRDSYSEALDCNTSDLIKMMILDACFVVEFFCVSAGVIPLDDDPLFSMPWIVSFLMLDVLMIENQIPIFVLREIYELSKSPSDADRSLDVIALGFFNSVLQWPKEDLQRYSGVCNITHLLDLFRLCLVGELAPENPPMVDKELLQLMPSANQLLQVGIKFKRRKSKNLISVEFDHGVLQIPPLTLDRFTSSFFLNCVAYEQSYHYCSKHISSYAVLMRCLMSTAADAAVLSQCGIITNFLGTDEEVARFFNDLVKDVLFDIKSSYLAELFGQVTQYRPNKWRVWWPGIKRKYFGSPWSFISAAAAFTLLVLTIFQAAFAVYAHYHPKK
ncbi:UPF0481 protein At3g47200-like [Syzygium oleosum]|uniref:UPF0481 protein At3g47200-like n=1 Tax=Syzygium oleosum TaxID=219896 RepID=UPI0011D1A405|nr:UPF0481 protein At3g47200-like [Syzygium oleosum]